MSGRARILGEGFYARQPDVVAVDLLGKVVRRRLGREALECRLVEVEAYFGACDPASRASRGPNGRIARRLRGPVGRLLVYPVHNKWMVNVVAHEEGMSGAVLFRSCYPVRGLDVMRVNRGVNTSDWRLVSMGPGRLSQALGIGREHDGLEAYKDGSPITIVDDGYRPESVRRTGRIGVREDLELPLRFIDASYTGIP
ncbi:MAG: DNA-3-methyladenine glycosylase [Desulfurococcales archaeon]|nr:DNA-3-methyladenine glycosylase [Desulfurococcales archaeon]